MIPCADGDAAAEMLQRRWFAAQHAVSAMSADCDTLREVLEMAEAAWREARARLARLENLRDAIDREFAGLAEGEAAGSVPDRGAAGAAETPSSPIQLGSAPCRRIACSTV